LLQQPQGVAKGKIGSSLQIPGSLIGSRATN
jgi:hypothetical protein